MIAGDTHNNDGEEREHLQYLTEIRELTQFAEDLAGIGVKDERLADAWERLGKYHEGYWQKGNRHATHRFCVTCRATGQDVLNHRVRHLDMAVQAYQKQLNIAINCYGKYQPEVRRIRAKRHELEDRRGRCDSPTAD